VALAGTDGLERKLWGGRDGRQSDRRCRAVRCGAAGRGSARAALRPGNNRRVERG